MHSRTRAREDRVGKKEQPESLCDILGAVLKVKGLDVACKEWDVVSDWKLIAGERIADVTECDRVEKGVLYVKVMSASWRQELFYLKDEIKKSILRETGCDTIKDIVFY